MKPIKFLGNILAAIGFVGIGYFALYGALMHYGGAHCIGVVPHKGAHHDRAAVLRAFTNGRTILPDFLIPIGQGPYVMDIGIAEDLPKSTKDEFCQECFSGTKKPL